MHRKLLLRCSSALALSFAAPDVFAHTGFNDASGLAHGIVHPGTGFDHVLALLAVGLWAAQRGGKSPWFAPSVFLAIMILGALMALTGTFLPGIELGVAASLAVFGLLLVAGPHLPAGVGIALIGFFALFHGYAHGAEMPATVSGLTYGIGLVLSSILLQGCGWLMGSSVGTSFRERFLQLAGAALAGAGIYLLAPM